MDELALNILDIACNSTAAGADVVEITIEISTKDDLITISVKDNGKGMSAELLRRVSDPFATTRKTRKVGMGIPLFKMAAEMCGGEFKIESELGIGTTTKATFVLSHVDRTPLGDIASTITTLIGGNPQIDFKLSYCVDGFTYNFDTEEIKAVLEGADITDVSVLSFIKDMIDENILNINKGVNI